MDLIEGKISNLKSFRDGLHDMIQDIVRDNDYVIIDMNTQRLYDEGTRADGSIIFPQYTDFTARIKSEKGQITSHVTLKDEGDFYSAFYIDFVPEGFEISSNDSKTDGLEEKYGEGIFGLTTDQKYEFSKDYLLPELINEINKV